MSRTVTTTRTVYQFAELSDRAKETARDWWRGVISESIDWAEYVIDQDAPETAALLGIDMNQHPVKLMNGSTVYRPRIYWSLDRSGGVGFDAEYRYQPGALAKLLRDRPATYTDRDGNVQPCETNTELHAIARRLQAAQRPNFYGLTAKIRAGRRDECSISVEVFDREGYEAAGKAADEIDAALQDFAHWIYSSLQRELDYRMSDEAVDEDITANTYEFNEDGEIV